LIRPTNLGFPLEEENRQVIENSIKNISFIIFIQVKKTGSRENEIEKLKCVDDELYN
jgi:hypothetical protein